MVHSIALTSNELQRFRIQKLDLAPRILDEPSLAEDSSSQRDLDTPAIFQSSKQRNYAVVWEVGIVDGLSALVKDTPKRTRHELQMR